MIECGCLKNKVDIETRRDRIKKMLVTKRTCKKCGDLLDDLQVVCFCGEKV